MKDKILPIIIAGFLLASCSSAYRSGQTPDDVYYSPTRELARVEEKEEEKKVEEKRTETADDQYLKMKVRNRYRWTGIDDYDYWNDTRYNTRCNCTCNPPLYGYGYTYPIRYNYNYNYPYFGTPYYPVLVYGNTRNVKGTTSGSNVRAYNTRTYSNTNSPVNPKTGVSTNNQGSLLKRIFTSSGSTVDRSQRTFPSPSTGSSTTTTTTSSSAGGKSGGYNSTGSSSSGGRGGRGN